MDYHISVEINSTKETDIKNRTCYFFHDMNSLKILDSNKTKIEENSYKSILIYYTGNMAPNSVKPVYLVSITLIGTLKKVMEKNDTSLTLVPY